MSTIFVQQNKPHNNPVHPRTPCVTQSITMIEKALEGSGQKLIKKYREPLEAYLACRKENNSHQRIWIRVANRLSCKATPKAYKHRVSVALATLFPKKLPTAKKLSKRKTVTGFTIGEWLRQKTRIPVLTLLALLAQKPDHPRKKVRIAIQHLLEAASQNTSKSLETEVAEIASQFEWKDKSSVYSHLEKGLNAVLDAKRPVSRPYQGILGEMIKFREESYTDFGRAWRLVLEQKEKIFPANLERFKRWIIMPTTMESIPTLQSLSDTLGIPLSTLRTSLKAIANKMKYARKQLRHSRV